MAEENMTNENEFNENENENRRNSDTEREQREQRGGGVKQREYGESDVLKQTRGEQFDTGRNR